MLCDQFVFTDESICSKTGLAKTYPLSCVQTVMMYIGFKKSPFREHCASPPILGIGSHIGIDPRIRSENEYEEPLSRRPRANLQTVQFPGSPQLS